MKHSTYNRVGYTQSDEEPVILKQLPCKGRFLDIGAYDGVTFSNTRALLEKGWSGVYVEPCPLALEKLRTNTKDHAGRVNIVRKAIAEHDGQAVFHQSGEMVGSLDEASTRRWRELFDFREITVETVTVKTLLGNIGSAFDMVSIDVEGCNRLVFDAMPWAKINPRLIVVEHDSEIERLSGYREVFKNGENLILVRE